MPQARIIGIILVEMMNVYNIDEQTGLWIASLTPVLIFAIGKLNIIVLDIRGAKCMVCNETDF